MGRLHAEGVQCQPARRPTAMGAPIRNCRLQGQRHMQCLRSCRRPVLADTGSRAKSSTAISCGMH